MNDTQPLTELDVLTLADVLRTRGEKIARTLSHGDVTYGHARYLCGEDLGPAPRDVREAHIRVTLQNGWDVAWSVAELVTDAKWGLYRKYDW